MSVIDYAQVNPRVGGFINPFRLNDPEYRAAYTKLARSCMYPAGYDNGLFNTIVGIIICVAGITCFTAGDHGALRYIGLGIGLVLGIVLGLIYGRLMQTKMLFPRGACVILGDSKKSVLTIAGPAIVYIAVPVVLYFLGNSAWQYFTLGAVCALIEQFAFYKSGRNLLLVTGFLLFIVPYIVSQMIGVSPDMFGNLLSVAPYEGLVLVCTGAYLSSKATSVVPRTHDRDLIRLLLSDENLSRKYLGLSFLSASLDSDMIPDLAKCMQHENYVIATTAQIAFGNLWGPKPRELNLPLNYGVSENLPESVRARYQDKFYAERKRILDRWTKHHTLIEERIADLAAQDDEAAEAVFALAEGKNVTRQHARITAIEMLGPMRTPRAYATLMTLLQHSDRRVARAAEGSFFGADSKAILYLEQFFVAPASWQRARAIRATRHLLDFLEIFDAEEHKLARALLEPDIDGLLDTPSTGTFAEAISLLPTDSQADIGVLEEYLRNDRPVIRIAALVSITRQCPDIAHDYLVKALDDQSAAVRYAAVLCVENLLPGDVGDLIAKMLDDPHLRVAECATEVMNRLNSNARPKSW